MRLIDAEALDNIVLRLNEEGRTITRNEYKTLDSIIFEFPTIEAEPVRRGHWEEKEIDDHPIDQWQSARCSVCGKYHTTPFMYYFNPFNYCPTCGAKMEEQE